MKTRAIFALLTALLMFAAPLLSLAETTETPAAPVIDYDHLTVGSTTRLSGNFFGETFGNNTADIDVWTLLHGYRLVTWDGEMGMYALDPTIVAGSIVSQTPEGNRVYTLSLQQDLYFSDGTQITARDYAFSILLTAAPEIAAIGGNVNGSDHLVGMDAYKAGETNVLAGVRVLGDYLLEIEIRADYLPFFFEQGLLNYCPVPIRMIAPGCEVADLGEGVFIRDEGSEDTVSALFTAELLQETLLAPETGFVSHPAVSSGPYVLTAFDAQTGAAEFEVNTCYKGNTQGIKPSIARLTFRHTTNETALDELRDGTLGLFNKVVNAETADNGRALVAEGPDFSVTNYARSGFSFVSFCTERPTISSQAVRQAIAHCLDADAFVSDYVRNYGLRVYGYYGLGQWMFQLVAGTLTPPVELPENPSAADQQAYDDAIAAWEELSLDNVPHYDLDLDAAAALLDADGWTLNSSGAPYDPAVDNVRCKDIDGVLVPLELSIIYPEGNEFGDAVQPLFADNLAQVGIQLTAEAVPFTDLLSIYYREVPRDVDMIYLASNFTVVFDPSGVFDPADAATGMLNRTAITDEELYQRAVDMRMTEPGDVLGYCTRWVAFQERWAEVLPAIPVYSNVYFDYYTSALQNYSVGVNMNWSTAIVPAMLGDYMPPEEDDEAEEELFFD